MLLGNPILMKPSAPSLFDPPRWPGGPRICVAANLPAFETVAEARDITRTNEGDSLKESWTCTVCGMIHATYKARPPSGATSGSGRVESELGPSMRHAMSLRVLKLDRP
jgi:hypothetical protein